MFKLANLSLPLNYTDEELANAMTAVVTYTMGDKIEQCGYDIHAIPAEGAADTGATVVRTAVIMQNPQATLLVTINGTRTMGVIPLSSDEADYVASHSDLVSRIATLLGYNAYVVFQYAAPTAAERSRFVWAATYRDWATDSNVFELQSSAIADATHGVWTAPNTEKAMFSVAGNAPNGVVNWSSSQVRLPLEYYITDMENVQDASRLAVTVNRTHCDEQAEVTTEVLAGVTELVGSLSVFGNSVKDVTQRYNAVTRYIPRP